MQRANQPQSKISSCEQVEACPGMGRVPLDKTRHGHCQPRKGEGERFSERLCRFVRHLVRRLALDLNNSSIRFAAIFGSSP